MRAVQQAEKDNTGELRVVIAKRCKGDALAEAKRYFVELGLQNTRGKTGVLLYFCPRDRKIAILGDQGIHELVGQAFWNGVIAHALVLLREGEVLRALFVAIDTIGQAFRRHLPRDQGEGDELPNTPVMV